jgi:hypothetical protein
MTSPRCNWTRDQIRAARRAALAPRLRRAGFALRDLGGENAELIDRPGLIVKAHYWRWPDQDRQGNAIDLLVGVLGYSFHDALRVLLDETD